MEGYGGVGGGYCLDEKAVRLENIFLEFLKTLSPEAEGGRGGGRYPPYYEADVEAMRPNESNTMFIDFSHVLTFNNVIQKAISDEFLRFEPYLNNACKRSRELTTAEIGKLVSVSGVVTRTSEVRPELVQRTFKCLNCGNVVKNVEQQFKYSEPIICMNATCHNRSKWALLRQESKFADWQEGSNAGDLPGNTCWLPSQITGCHSTP